MIRLTNDADRAAWLQCLQAASAMAAEAATRSQAGMWNPEFAVELADRLFAEYQRRSER